MSVVSQGTSVFFNGSPLGYLTEVSVVGGTAQLTETTNVTSYVVGYGGYSRVVRTYDCLAIDPGSVTARLWGVPPFNPGSIGAKGPLYVYTPGGSYMFPEAILETFDVTSSVGQLMVGTATFRVTGGPVFAGAS